MKVKKKTSVLLGVILFSSSAFAGSLMGNVYGGAGTTEVKPKVGTSRTDTGYEIGFGSKYVWSPGITFGADFGVGYTTVKNGYQNETTPYYDLNGVFKLGYTFGKETGKGLGIYGLYGATFGFYEAKTSQTVTTTGSFNGMGAGAQVEYIFDNGIGVSAVYQNYAVNDKDGNNYGDIDKITVRLSYQWAN